MPVTGPHAGWLRLATIATVVTGSWLAVPQRAVAAGPAWPDVAMGASGPNVKTIQLLLVHRGHDIAADGVFGAVWLLAVYDHRPPSALFNLPTTGCF